MGLSPTRTTAMDVMRQKRVEAVFMEALAAREAGAEVAAVRELIAQRCAGEGSVLGEVESLLAMHERAEGPLDRGNPLIAGTIPGGSAEDSPGGDEGLVAPGQRIGHYTITRVLGSGGMGVVYVAEQERPRRTVALKVIRPSVTSPAMLRRFEHEAEVLGRLHHPGIAQIYEAGTAEVAHPRTGAPMRVPFLAMELVDGSSLIDHARERGLGTREKLELIRLVCQAVQHAHQKGVIHRDLKPSNILVAGPDEPKTDGAGHAASRSGAPAQPKVLDFGVARVTDADLRVTTLRTSVGQLIGTLPYMSPEQVAGDPDGLDIRSDVYALGVILYQLLTGRLPHDVSSRSVPEAARMIRDEHPSRLSVLDRTFRGEIDTIVAKAMEKDRARRYQSAEELGEDLRRHLAGEAIQARRDSTMYVLRKQLRRYKWAVAAASVFVVMVLAFGIYASVQAARQGRLARALGHELACANIERGRALGYAGSAPAAETVLWRELLANPESRLARWALWEHYARRPIVRTVVDGDSTGTSLLISSDGGVALIRTRGDELQVWDGRLTELRRRIPLPHGADITACALAPDGRTVLTAGADGVIREYDAASGDMKREWSAGPERPRALAALDGGRTVVCGSRGGWLTVWSDGSPEPAHRFRGHGTSEIWNMRASADGRYLATTGRDRAVRIWDTRTWAPVHAIEGFESLVFAVEFLPDGRRVLVGGDRGRVSCYRIGDDAPEWSVPTASPMPVRIALGPSDNEGSPRHLVCGGEGSVELWDFKTRERLSTLAAHEGGIYSVAVSPLDGSILVTGGGAGGAVARVWEDRAFRCLRTFGATGGRVGALAVSPDGRHLVSADATPAVRLWDTRRGRDRTLIRGLRSLPGRAVAFSAGGEWLALGLKDERIELRRAPGYDAELTLLPALGAQAVALALSPSGDRLVCGSPAGELCVMDVPSGRVRVAAQATAQRINSAQWSPDGRLIAITAARPGIILLDADSLAPVGSSGRDAWAAAFHPRGTSLAVAAGESVEILDAPAWTRRVSLDGHSDTVSDVEFSPDGTLVASCSGDRTLRLWDPAEGRHLATLECAGEVTEIAFAPDGRSLYGARANGEIVAWDLGYYDGHIAGNLDHMAAAVLGGAERESPRVAALRAWAAEVLRGAGRDDGAAR